MPHSDYCQLIDQICALKNLERPPSRHRRFDIVVDGTAFTLLPSGGETADVDAIAYFSDFGALPEEEKALVLLRLLETNLYMVDRDAPAFCVNPETGHVVLAGCVPLARINAEALLNALGRLAQFALQWRADRFLTSTDARQSSTPRTSSAARPTVGKRTPFADVPAY